MPMLLLALCSWVAAADMLSVTDDTGREIRLDQPARRILTLAPHATELVLALELDDRLVAVADFSDYPASLDSLPRLSSLGGIDREQLLLLDPDLVIAWASGNREADIRWLAMAGIPVYLSEPENLQAIGESLERLARLAGVPERGRKVAERYRRRLAQVCSHRRNQPPLATYYAVWSKPPMTIGGRHWLNEALAKARLHNIFADLPRKVVTVSRESLLARPHDLVITTVPDSEEPAGGKRIIVADATLGRPGPRILEGLEKLCEKL